MGTGISMKSIWRLTTEIIAAIWLIIVSAQYMARYFYNIPDIDFKAAYIAMIFLTPVFAGAGFFIDRITRGKTE
jgi:hypothetical protein